MYIADREKNTQYGGWCRHSMAKNQDQMPPAHLPLTVINLRGFCNWLELSGVLVFYDDKFTPNGHITDRAYLGSLLKVVL